MVPSGVFTNSKKLINILSTNIFGDENIEPAKVQARQHVYLDNNATTALSDKVHAAMAPYLERKYGNPSSLHTLGRQSREAVEKARRQLASLLNTKPRRIIFTGGGSEADNLALKGVAFHKNNKSRGGHIITTKVEHPAVLGACEFLQQQGFQVTYLDVDVFGWVEPATLKRAMTKDTLIVSIMMANNEVGTLQPIKELCAIAHEAGALFHTDAVQAIGKIPVDVEALGVDLLSLSAHKFHGPKGVGALFVRRDTPVEPLIHGGQQEQGLRAGTENLAAIIGLGQAAELARQGLMQMTQVQTLRDCLQTGIEKIIQGARLNGHPTQRLPNTLNLTLPSLRAESLVVAMDQKGIALSSGSACKSGSPDPSHALLAMGLSAEDAHCALRISLSTQTTQQDVDNTLTALTQVLDEMKSAVRFLPCK